MGYNILLYGATGYTGRLIAAEGERCGMSASSPSAAGDRMILAARDGAALQNLADRYGMDFRVFGLDDNRASSTPPARSHLPRKPSRRPRCRRAAITWTSTASSMST
jgi:short subunit dehydrogenase-like uncharacterized protein